MGGNLSPLEITTDFSYIRLHGPQKAYSGSYGPKMLDDWKNTILDFYHNQISTYCYFDNDEKGFAIKDALTLKKLIE